MTRDELRDLIIQAKEIIPKLEKAWRYLEEEQIISATEVKQLPCDTCEDDLKLFSNNYLGG